VAKTLLAVDDSTTMRKVLEITFSGEDFRVITAEGGHAALGRLGENPNVFVIDTVLGGEDGYAVAKEIRRRAPTAAILMLASRYNPYDQARGRDAGADDWADKPFDTQQLIDKVRKVIVARESGVPHAAASAPAMPQPTPAAPPYRAPAQQQQPMAAAPQPQPQPPLGRGTQPSLGGAAQRTGTLTFGEPPAHQQPQPAARPQPAPVAVPPPPPALAPAAHVSSAVNGHLAGKLGELGLTPQQADAVLALSREVVERVVWEVVPQLAETIIKEEIARLTREG
jgi:CheY-like chemotaxis protein